MKQTFHVEVSERYTARIEVRANSSEEAEKIADELVGGGKVNIVNLALSGTPDAQYSKTCEVCEA